MRDFKSRIRRSHPRKCIPICNLHSNRSTCPSFFSLNTLKLLSCRATMDKEATTSKTSRRSTLRIVMKAKGTSFMSPPQSSYRTSCSTSQGTTATRRKASSTMDRSSSVLTMGTLSSSRRSSSNSTCFNYSSSFSNRSSRDRNSQWT